MTAARVRATALAPIVPMLTAMLVVSTFLPWAASGTVDRSAWAVVGSARRLGVVDSWAAGMFASAFYAVPALFFASLIAFGLSRQRVGVALCGGAVVATVVVAAAILRSSLRPRWGLWLNIIVSVVDGVLVITCLWRLRQDR